MKQLLVFFSFLVTGLSFGQYEWETMTNPLYNVNYVTDAEMLGGKLYQAYDSVGYLTISSYSPATLQWTREAQTYLGSMTRMQMEAADGNLFVVADQYYSFVSVKYDPVTHQFTTLTPPTAIYVGNNWELRSGGTATELFFLWLDNGSGTTVKLSRLDPATNTWLTYDITSTMNSAGVSLNSNKLELYINPTDVYVGVSGTSNNILASAPLSAIPSIHFYNTSGSNDGKIRVNSAVASGSFYLSGDGTNAPNVTFTTSASVSYQTAVSTTDVDILTASATPLTFVPSANDWFVINDPVYAYTVSNFGVNAPDMNKFQVYRQDLTTMAFDSVGPRLETTNPTLNQNTLTADLSDNGKHMVVSYKTSTSTWKMKVLNQAPFVSDQTQSTGLCTGHKNLIYPDFQISDADGEPARILSLSSLNGHISNFFAQELHYTPGSTTTRGYAIYGQINSQNTDAVIVTYTDGWGIVTDTLNSFQALSPVPPLAFVDNPAHICTNEQMVNLDALMIYTADGTYSFNGVDLPTATFDATSYGSLTSGTLLYKINVNGCYVQAQTTVNLVNPGVATVTTTPATCGANDGTATVTFTNGTSTNYSLVWSTGDASATISNLSPGQYTATYSDGYGCHTTAMAMVGATGISVTPTVTPVSCYGAADGAISLNVSGMSNYTVLWSNGTSQPAISQLTAGNYEVTVTDGQCPVHVSIAVTQPAPINASFSVVQPNCGSANGSVSVTATGDGPLSYTWPTASQSGPTLSGATWGIYPIEITDVHGCMESFSVTVNDNQSAVLSDSVMFTDCNQSNGAINLTAVPNASNNNSVTYLWSDGETTEDITALSSGTYNVVVAVGPNTNGFQCYSSMNIPVGIKAPQRQDICLVTVDLGTTTNLVVWEKVQDSASVSYYRIYRENGNAGDYMLIDTVQYGSESVFNDVVANPMDRSWRYKISAVNSCGIESTISTAHKTLHLNSILLLTDGSYDIYWDEYEGLTGLEYRVNRYSDQNGWEQLSPTYPMGTTFSHDVPTGLTGVDYYVEMVPTSTCTAEKAQDFNSSRSNKDKGNFYAGSGTGDSNNGLEENALNNLDIYPNPVHSALFVVQETAEPLAVEIYSANGKKLLAVQISELTNQIDVSNISSGLYMMKIMGQGAERVVRFVKN